MVEGHSTSGLWRHEDDSMPDKFRDLPRIAFIAAVWGIYCSINWVKEKISGQQTTRSSR